MSGRFRGALLSNMETCPERLREPGKEESGPGALTPSPKLFPPHLPSTLQEQDKGLPLTHWCIAH